MSKGIDYGMGQTNIDPANGIRFGVICANDLNGDSLDAFEPEYGDPTCPECGNDAVSGDSDIDPETLAEIAAEYKEAKPDTDADVNDMDRDDLGYETLHHACGDYACDSCRLLFDGEDAFGDEPLCHTYEDEGYIAVLHRDNDIFVTKSPYFTRAAFCSPCAPGACYLTSPVEDGPRCYCLGHDWFEDGEAPYPVYLVATGTLVISPKQEAAEAEEYEPQEGDYTTDDYRKWYQYGKLVLETRVSRDADHAHDYWMLELLDHMDKQNFWPNAFVISDHGNPFNIYEDFNNARLLRESIKNAMHLSETVGVKEGWALFETNGEQVIQRIDETELLKDDDEAVALAIKAGVICDDYGTVCVKRDNKIFVKRR